MFELLRLIRRLNKDKARSPIRRVQRFIWSYGQGERSELLCEYDLLWLRNVPGEVWNEDDRVKGVMPDNAPVGCEWAQGEDNDWKLKREGPSGIVIRRMYTADGRVIDVKMPDHWDPNRVKYTGAIRVRVYTEQQVAAARKL